MHESIDTGHGRIESRRTYALDVQQYKKHFPSAKKWEKLSQVLMVESVRHGADNETRIRKEVSPENFATFRHMTAMDD